MKKKKQIQKRQPQKKNKKRPNNENWNKLFTDCLIELQNHGVKTKFVKDSKLLIASDGSLCQGYWEDSDARSPILICSLTGSIKEWGQIFVHEFAHFQQWKEKSDIWKKARKYTINDQHSVINNKPISKKRILNYLANSMLLELDAEKRAVKLFKKYNVPIDLKAYIKGANLYVFFQLYLYHYRDWSNTFPSDIPELMKLVKPTFYRSYNKIPKALFKGFQKYYPPCKCPRLL